MYINSNSIWGGPFGGAPYTISLYLVINKTEFEMKLNPTVRDLNAKLQDGLDRGMKLELIITSDGLTYLQWVNAQ